MKRQVLKKQPHRVGRWVPQCLRANWPERFGVCWGAVIEFDQAAIKKAFGVVAR
jgi:hypothetical protein